MSAMVGTSRASRPSKDKNAKPTPAPATHTPTPNKTDRSAAKNQATVEQMRMAQMMDSGKESAANVARVRQLVEMTGRTEEDVVVALHDAQDDLDRAVLLLLEGGQGEWESQGKKKKRSNTGKPEKDGAPSMADGDLGDSRPDRSRDRRDHDRHDVPPRRGGRDRRNGGPPPRLARGRGRDRNHFGGPPPSGRDRSSYNGEQESGGRMDRGERMGERMDHRMGGQGEREADWDTEPIMDPRDRRPERGQFGGGERGRGRGRGGFSRPTVRGGRPRRFDRPDGSSDGPHIDTWTNETAENAEKENSWGETWGESTEDWSEDTWTGSLDDTKVFTASQTNSIVEPDLNPALNDTTNTIGQRLDVGSLFSKSAEFAKAPDFTKTSESPGGDSFFSQYNQQATESIKNSIGIGSSPRQNMSSLPPSSSSQSQQPPAPLGPLGSLPQRDLGSRGEIGQGSVRGSLASMMPPASSSALPPGPPGPPSSAQQQVQRRQRRSNLPPPSKIPQSAVEMPGHMLPNKLDVQFGVDFGSDSSALQFGFGSSSVGGDPSVSSFPSSSASSSSGLSNHLGGGSNKTSVDASRQGSVMSSPSAGSKAPPPTSSLPPAMDASPSRPASSVFPSAVYSTTPTKQDAQPSKPDPIPFPSASDHKSSGLVNSQRTAPSPAALSQGSLSTSKPDTSTLPNFSAANGYGSSSYSAHSAPHKSGGHASASPAQQTYPPHPAVTSQSPAAGYQSQYASQNQYPGSQSQFPSAGQTQYPGSHGSHASHGSHGSQSQYGGSGSGAGAQTQYLGAGGQYGGGGSSAGQSPFPPPPSVTQSQYPSGASQYGAYQVGSASSFQTQSAPGASSQQGSAQNSLYPAQGSAQPQGGSQPGSTYPPSATSSFHVGGREAGSASQTGGVSQASNAYQAPPPPAPGLKASSSSANSSQQPQQPAYSTQSYSSSQQHSQHAASMQPAALTNKLGDSLSKISLKDATLDSRTSSQYEHGSASTASSTTTSSSISTVTSTVSATSTPVATSSTLNSRNTSANLPMTTKAPPNLPPGVPLLNPAHQYIMGQAGTLPPFYGLQQPVYGYEDMQMLQQRLPALQTGSYYDMSAFPGVPSTIAGRDQAAALGTAPFTGAATEQKTLNRVEAQSPNAGSSGQQSGHSAPQQTLPFNIHYGYYYPGAVLPGAASFQYPTMFPMPPVTNAPAPHVPGTTTATQLPKTYGSHQGYVSKGTGTTADMNTAAYTKSHTQGFDKQGFPGGTPPPFSLPLASASQAGPLGAPAAPYGAPFLPMMPPQPHNQTILHHPLQQDSGAGSARSLQQPGASQGKTGATKPYGTYWGN